MKGWIPKGKLAQLNDDLNTHLDNPVVIEASAPKPENYAKAPSYIVHPEWLRPFEQLIKNYGTQDTVVFTVYRIPQFKYTNY